MRNLFGVSMAVIGVVIGTMVFAAPVAALVVTRTYNITASGFNNNPPIAIVTG